MTDVRDRGSLASRQLTVEMLGQQALAEEERTVEELMMLHCPAKGPLTGNVVNMSGNMTRFYRPGISERR